MSALALSLAFLFLQQGSFTEFSFCREGMREDDPVYCIRLDAEGAGAFITRERGRSYEEPMQLSARANKQLVELLEKTEYLKDGSEYESGRDVAVLGRKILAVEGEWGRREAAFNYTARREVNTLQTFLDRLIAQEQLIVDLDSALQFDRLGLASLLERTREELRRNRVPDPAGLLEVLGRIAEDQRVLNLARTSAREIIEDIPRE